jgi:hypothetical protein
MAACSMLNPTKAVSSNQAGLTRHARTALTSVTAPAQASTARSTFIGSAL